ACWPPAPSRPRPWHRRWWTRSRACSACASSRRPATPATGTATKSPSRSATGYSVTDAMNRQRTHLSGARQQGAALYVALMMLILLALIGLVGMQVAGMQERMASAYRAANLAFQNAEAYVRQTECGLERLNGVPDVPASNCALVSQADIQ